jgi:hypothetical protein
MRTGDQWHGKRQSAVCTFFGCNPEALHHVLVPGDKLRITMTPPMYRRKPLVACASACFDVIRSVRLAHFVYRRPPYL